jgi:hypothetical protein
VKRASPKVGEVWDVDVRGQTPWADSTVGPVRVTWASDDGRVFEGHALRPRSLPKKVHFAACDVLRRSEVSWLN